MKNKIPIICTAIVITEVAAGLLYLIYDKSCAIVNKLNEKDDKIKCHNIFCPYYKDECEISAYRAKHDEDTMAADKPPEQILTEQEEALIEGVELGIDWALDVPEEHLKRYNELINRRHEFNKQK